MASDTFSTLGSRECRDVEDESRGCLCESALTSEQEFVPERLEEVELLKKEMRQELKRLQRQNF